MIHNARRAVQWRQIQQKAQDYSGFGLKPQTPTPKSAQLASRAPVRAEWRRVIRYSERDFAHGGAGLAEMAAWLTTS
jgi:hypothetical protein